MKKKYRIMIAVICAVMLACVCIIGARLNPGTDTAPPSATKTPGTTPGELRNYLNGVAAVADEYTAFFKGVAADPASILESATTTRLRAIGAKARRLVAPPEFRETHRWFVAASHHYDNAANCADRGDLDCTIAEMKLGTADIDRAYAELLVAKKQLGL